VNVKIRPNSTETEEKWKRNKYSNKKIRKECQGRSVVVCGVVEWSVCTIVVGRKGKYERRRNERKTTKMVEEEEEERRKKGVYGKEEVEERLKRND
jgi:hypothetical protein